MSKFAAVITYQFEGESVNSLVLDTIEDDTINSRITITQQPLVSGDTISDHQFNQPKTMIITGAYSLNGSNTVFDTNTNKIVNFEDLLERIQHEGVLCDVSRISLDDTDNVRFKQRHNMLLDSITFRQGINSVRFTLSFTQTLLANVLEYNVDPEDEKLPTTTSPNAASFTNVLIDFAQLDALIIQILKDNQYIDDGFWNALRSVSSDQWAAAGLFAGVGAAGIIAGIATLASVGVTTGGIGFIVAGVAAVGVGIYLIGKSIRNTMAKRKKAKQQSKAIFTWSNNADKNQQELEKFADFITSLHNEIAAIEDLIHVYQVSTNEPQSVIMSIGNDAYKFDFTQNNINGTYSLNVENQTRTSVKSMPNIATCPESIDEFTLTNYIVKTSNNARVYLACPSQDKKDLTNYCVVVCDFDPTKFTQLLTDIIDNYIVLYKGA